MIGRRNCPTYMIPRLRQTREALTGIELHLQTSDHDLDIVAETFSWPFKQATRPILTIFTVVKYLLVGG